MIKIEPNNYVQTTEVREEVVQAICDAFLHSKRYKVGCEAVYHPFNGSNRGCRNAHRYVVCNKKERKYHSFSDKPFEWQEGLTFTGAEMKRAFEELIKAGYYMLKVYSYGSWMGYECHDKPFDDFYRTSQCVQSFDDRID